MQIIKRHLEDTIDKEYWENANAPSSIVWHTLRGTLEGSYAWLEHIDLSYHYILDEDGSIYELVDPRHSAWHAGIVKNPNKRARGYFGTINPNLMSIGIAFVRNGQATITRQQRSSAVWLLRHLDTIYHGIRERDKSFAHVEIRSDKPKEVLRYVEQIFDTQRGEKGEREKIHLTPQQEKSILQWALSFLFKRTTYGK